VREHGSTPGIADEIAAAITGRALLVEALVQAVLDGQATMIREHAADLGLDGEMLCTLLRFSLFPALRQTAAQLAPLAATARWQRGYCPICGSWALLGEHRGLEQTRFLRCGMCAAGWPVDRLLCPFCGSRNHEDLGYLHVEGEEQKRVVTCEQCRGYVKVLASLAAIPPLDLMVHDLATIHLDIVAIERGYAAPA
jgi:FdhE protein